MQVEEMDDLQKLSVYMHYYIDSLIMPTTLNLSVAPFDWNPYEVLKYFKMTGVMFIDTTHKTVECEITCASFDEFKEKYINGWWDIHKNEIKLV